MGLNFSCAWAITHGGETCFISSCRTCLLLLCKILSTGHVPAADPTAPWGQTLLGRVLKQAMPRLRGRGGTGKAADEWFAHGLCVLGELFSSSSLIAPIFLAALAFPSGISSDVCIQVVKEVVQRAKKKKKKIPFFPHQNLNIFWRKCSEQNQPTNQPTKPNNNKSSTHQNQKQKQIPPPSPKPTISFVCKFPGGSGGSLTKMFLRDSFLGSSLLSMETCPQQILYYFLTCLQGGVSFVDWGKEGACFSFDTPISAIREGSRWQFRLENSDKNCTGVSLPSPAGDVSDAACSCCWKWPDQRNVSWRVNSHQQAMFMSWGQLPEWLGTQRLLRQDFKVLGNLLCLKRSHNITGRNEGGK